MAAGQYQDFAVAAANKYGVPVDMFLWQIGKESSWNPNARNPNSTATGIAQFTKGTAKDFNLNPLDPYASLDAAAKYDAQLFKKHGSWEGALTAYGTLHDADPKTMAAFNESLNKSGTDTGFSWGDAVKKVWDNSAFGLATDTYKEISGEGEPSGEWDFAKLLSSTTLVILGIVVIAVAILSNKTVQAAAVTAVKKGK